VRHGAGEGADHFVKLICAEAGKNDCPPNWPISLILEFTSQTLEWSAGCGRIMDGPYLEISAGRDGLEFPLDQPQVTIGRILPMRW